MRRHLASLAILAAGCTGAAGEGGARGETALIAADAVDAGENCARGGTRLRLGVDANGDGVLDDAEVGQVRTICNGDGSAALFSTADGAAGCAAGGLTIHWGLDLDGDGALAEGERMGSFAVCNGASGANGSIQILDPIEPGGICAAGGFVLSFGRDTNGDGVLGAQEIEGSSTICNGVDGLASLIEQVELNAGSEWCANGGVLFRTGLDADRDGSLDPEEVDGESALCLLCPHPGSSNCTSATFLPSARVDLPYAPGQFAVGDLDGDGHQDVVLTQRGGSDLQFWRGLGDGAFAPPTAAGAGVGDGGPIVLRDFDGDGHVDTVATRAGGAAFLPGNGDGSFGAAVAIPAISDSCNSIAVADFDGDSVADIVVTTPLAIQVLRGNGDGTFALAQQFNRRIQWPQQVTTGDLDGDGNPDLVWVESDLQIFDARLVVALNNGDGTFAGSIAVDAPSGTRLVHLGHFDADGHLDALIASAGGIAPRRMELRLGDGQGGFGPQSFANGAAARALALADFDGDGRVDVVTTELGSVTKIYRGEGDGSLAAASLDIDGGGEYLALGDFNDDGKVDVVVGHYDTRRIEVLLGN